MKTEAEISSAILENWANRLDEQMRKKKLGGIGAPSGPAPIPGPAKMTVVLGIFKSAKPHTPDSYRAGANPISPKVKSKQGKHYNPRKKPKFIAKGK